MRPTIFIAFLWTLGSCVMATAQSPEQRPTNLRNAGIITRAAPPTSLATSPAQPQPSPQPSPQMPPTNFPAAPASESSSAALSDRAWTSGPTRSHASASLSDAPTASSVVPAQFINNDRAGPVSPAPISQIRLANHQTASGEAAAATHEPRPLKPPTTSASKVSGNGSTGTVQMFVSVLSSLAIVIGLILAAAWFYRKAAPTMSGALPKQVVQVLGRTQLAPRQQLVLLRLGSKLILVSNLHGEVRTISEITDPLEVDRLAGLCESAQPGSISDSFRSVLHNMGRNG